MEDYKLGDIVDVTLNGKVTGINRDAFTGDIEIRVSTKKPYGVCYVNPIYISPAITPECLDDIPEKSGRKTDDLK